MHCSGNRVPSLPYLACLESSGPVEDPIPEKESGWLLRADTCWLSFSFYTHAPLHTYIGTWKHVNCTHTCTHTHVYTQVGIIIKLPPRPVACHSRHPRAWLSAVPPSMARIPLGGDTELNFPRALLEASQPQREVEEGECTSPSPAWAGPEAW